MILKRPLITFFLLFSIFIIFNSCTKENGDNVAKTPDEELTEYAQSSGGKWFSEDNALVYERMGSLDDIKLKNLSKEAIQRIRKVYLLRIGFTEIPELNFLPKLNYLHLSSNTITDLSPLEGLNLKVIIISENPFSDLSPLAQMSTLEDATLGTSSIEGLPDLSEWVNIKKLGFSGSTIKSLKNLETIPSNFDLWIWECDQLEDIDALRYARVNTLFIDEKNYERLKPWFDKYFEEIKERRPEFNIRLDMFE